MNFYDKYDEVRKKLGFSSAIKYITNIFSSWAKEGSLNPLKSNPIMIAKYQITGDSTDESGWRVNTYLFDGGKFVCMTEDKNVFYVLDRARKLSERKGFNPNTVISVNLPSKLGGNPSENEIYQLLKETLRKK